MSAANKSVTLAIAVALASAGCTNLSSARIQPDAVEAGANLRPIAAIQADAISAYVLFIPLPGVELDQVVNQMLIVAAKTMGADNLTFEITPDGGIWALRKLLGYRSARASGIAVQVTEPSPDPGADEGPEPAAPPPEPAGVPVPSGE
jgi:hypothetical protein